MLGGRLSLVRYFIVIGNFCGISISFIFKKVRQSRQRKSEPYGPGKDKYVESFFETLPYLLKKPQK
jgi:hypothetical protein